jgi:hypothetical protein
MLITWCLNEKSPPVGNGGTSFVHLTKQNYIKIYLPLRIIDTYK